MDFKDTTPDTDPTQEMFPVSLVLESTDAAVEISTRVTGSQTIVKMRARVVEPRKVFTDGGLDVRTVPFYVWIYAQGDEDLTPPEGAIGRLICIKAPTASVMMAPAQFEQLQSAVLLGSSFEVLLEVDGKKRQDQPETLLRTEAFKLLPVLEAVFTAEQATPAVPDHDFPKI
jgi:hypothetical protein